jgi:DNA-binding LacI/PurR family transcriptional regulator
MPSRWNEIAKSLQSAIARGEMQPGDRLPSETDLAATWNVCRATAHRAMTELHRQGLVTRKRRVGTIVSHRKPVVSPRKGGVALLFFHHNDFPQVEYLHGFRAALPDEYHVLFCDIKNDPQREALYLQRMQEEADAICCYPTCDPANTVLLQKIIESGTPLVCLDRLPEGLEADAVVTDNYGSSLAALRMLTAQGHRRIAFLTTENKEVSSIRERYEAFKTAMIEAGNTDIAPLIRSFPCGMGYNFDLFSQAVHDALFTLLHQPDPPTAVFCLEDYFLAATREACDRMGLVVPKDLEILSFSDCPPMLTRITGGVHRIVQQAYNMGGVAAERVLARLHGDRGPVRIERVPALFYPAHPPITTGERGGKTGI